MNEPVSIAGVCVFLGPQNDSPLLRAWRVHRYDAFTVWMHSIIMRPPKTMEK